MTRHLLVAAALAGCAAPSTPTVTDVGGEARLLTVGTVSAPSPVEARPHTVPKASRTRPFTGLTAPGSGSLLNWAALRECESSGNYQDRDSSTYRGAYQFDYTTWASVGGSGDPADASPAEQDMRAHLLYAARGRQPWPVCGRWL